MPERGKPSDPLQRWYREDKERQRVRSLFHAGEEAEAEEAEEEEEGEGAPGTAVTEMPGPALDAAALGACTPPFGAADMASLLGAWEARTKGGGGGGTIVEEPLQEQDQEAPALRTSFVP